MKKYIPNTITLINLTSGCMAVMCACFPLEMIAGHPAYIIAFCFILLASVADFMDGLSARMLGEYSPLGKQLDSLSDLVSFGVAPAMVLSNLLLAAHAPLWSRLLCLLLPICGAIRLARFNLDTSQVHSFKGLPIPAAALFCIGLAAMLASETGANLYATVGCVVIISILMVSPIRMYSFKLGSFSFRNLALPVSLVIVGGVCVVMFGWTGLFYTVGYYILSAFVSSLFVLTPVDSTEE
ncbi:MAG: CDP-diacylglycerol--serine O-phosphatidyltransferase [Prevotella sp.]|nr:CDP-diacylglycerol--serine O-phosphatidyltransferase [Prevotella sp.]MCM1074552.1 CDP-diacylglycerol--serine O-phosphatidyltransferase [Ruminococcus sp.]